MTAYACHCPDLFAGDFILNLASDDDAHWERSIDELPEGHRAHPVAAGATSTHERADPVVIASVGGFTKDAPRAARRAARHVRAGRPRGSTASTTSGVRLCAQTLPPFPWYMGGQLYCNLFVGAGRHRGVRASATAAGSASTCRTPSSPRTSTASPFSEASTCWLPTPTTCTSSTPTGVDGEGVQVGDGEIDWPVLARQLDRLAPGVGFIPEIWQGHVNNGEGFWIALERLEQWF